MSASSRGPLVFQSAELRVESSSPVPLDRFLKAKHEGSSWGAVRQLIRTGKVFVEGVRVTSPETLVAPGAAVSLRMTAERHRGGSTAGPDVIVHVDAHVVVVRKPAGIATVPYEDENDTLDRLVQTILRRTAPRGTSVGPLGVVQRLDRDTSGLLVFARTLLAKRHLQQQLRAHTVTRRYLAIAHGRLTSRTITSRLVQDRGDGVRGSTTHSSLGRLATTHVRVLEELGPATLVECRLETGRTHQIRIHLAEAGHPLLGERVYQRGYRGILLPAPRILLHAAELGFVHPGTGRPMHFEEPPPDDFVRALEALRAAMRQD